MGVLNTIGGASAVINVAGSALSLVGMGAALIKPRNPPPGIAGFLFDIKMSENVSQTAQVTDHFTEDNYAIQDHVALEPVKITLTGRVGELVHTKAAALAFLSAVIDRLSPLGIFTPAQGAEAQKAIASANLIVNTYNSIETNFKSLSDVLLGEPALNKQQKAYATFDGYFQGRSLLTVETPWRTYENMLIENWSADQGEESIYETTFTLTFKQLRLVSTETNKGTLRGRIAQQKASMVDKGKVRGKSIIAATVDKTSGTGAN